MRRIRLALLPAFLGLTPPAIAADHFDGPDEVDDPATDLGDVFVWRTDDDRIAFALTIAPGLSAGEGPIYDVDVLYAIRLDTDRDFAADQQLLIQFGEPSDGGEMGVRVRGLPGGDVIVGPVEQVLAGAGSNRVWAGLRDDPLFFDDEGWNETLATGVFALDPDRDAHAMTNTVAVVIEVDADAYGGGPMRVWATSGRWGS